MLATAADLLDPATVQVQEEGAGQSGDEKALPAQRQLHHSTPALQQRHYLHHLTSKLEHRLHMYVYIHSILYPPLPMSSLCTEYDITSEEVCVTFMSFPEEYAQTSTVPVWSHVMATTLCLSFSCILYPLDCVCVCVCV